MKNVSVRWEVRLMLWLSQRYYKRGQMVTDDFLKSDGACIPQRRLFHRHYPEGVEMSPDAFLRAPDGLTIFWLSACIGDDGGLSKNTIAPRWREELYYELRQVGLERRAAMAVMCGLPKWATPLAVWLTVMNEPDRNKLEGCWPNMKREYVMMKWMWKVAHSLRGWGLLR